MARHAPCTAPTGNAGFHCNSVATFQTFNRTADRVYYPGGFVAKDHGGIKDEGSNAAMCPVVDLANVVSIETIQPQ